MKKSLILSLGFLIVLLVLAPQFLFLQNIRNQKLAYQKKRSVDNQKILYLEKERERLLIVSKKIIAQEKNHAIELSALKENTLQHLFFATELVHQHQLNLVSSHIDEQKAIQMTLSGRLENFMAFFTDLAKNSKSIRLNRIAIHTQPFTFQVVFL